MGVACCMGRNSQQEGNKYQEVKEGGYKNPFAAMFGAEDEQQEDLLSRLDTNGFQVGYAAFLGLRQADINVVYELGGALPNSTSQATLRAKSTKTGFERIVKYDKKASIVAKNRELLHKIEVARQLDHPNILRIFEVYDTETHFFYVGEIHSGGDLMERINNEPKMSEKIIAGYLKQLLQAVAYLHHQKIAHRDIRPEKILFSNITNEATLILSGFKYMKQIGENDILTENVGKLDYKAPEVMGKNYNEKCDIWSCGVILYRLLCGRPPYQGSSDEKMRATIEKKPLSFEGPKISNEAKGLLQLLLQVDPSKRISAQQALGHPWFNIVSKPNRSEFAGPLQSFKSFQPKNEVQLLFLIFTFHQFLNSHEREKLTLIFNEIDADHDGYISSDEISSALERDSKGMRLSQTSNRSRNQNDRISYTEFVVGALSGDQRLKKEKAELAFRNLDMDADGYLKKSELRNVLGGLNLTEKDYSQIFSDAGSSEQKGISKQQFLSLIL